MNNDNNIELPKKNDSNIQNEINNQEVSMTENNNNNNNNIGDEVKKVVEDVKEVTSKEIENSGKFLKDVRNYITTKNSSELFALLWRLVLIVGFIILLYFPFQLLMDLGVNLFMIFGFEYTTPIANIWTGVWNISYSILALVLFYKLCKDRYYKLTKNVEEKIKEI